MANQLPYQNAIDRVSGPTKEGFDIIKTQYSSKISQKVFDGPSQEASRQSIWKVRWKQLEYFTPAEVSGGAVSTFDIVKQFYEDNYIGEVEWQPFEAAQSRIWEIVPGSWRQVNPAGRIFDVSFSLKYLYSVV